MARTRLTGPSPALSLDNPPQSHAADMIRAAGREAAEATSGITQWDAAKAHQRRRAHVGDRRDILIYMVEWAKAKLQEAGLPTELRLYALNEDGGYRPLDLAEVMLAGREGREPGLSLADLARKLGASAEVVAAATTLSKCALLKALYEDLHKELTDAQWAQFTNAISAAWELGGLWRAMTDDRDREEIETTAPAGLAGRRAAENRINQAQRDAMVAMADRLAAEGKGVNEQARLVAKHFNRGSSGGGVKGILAQARGAPARKRTKPR